MAIDYYPVIDTYTVARNYNPPPFFGTISTFNLTLVFIVKSTNMLLVSHEFTYICTYIGTFYFEDELHFICKLLMYRQFVSVCITNTSTYIRMCGCMYSMYIRTFTSEDGERCICT